MRARSVPSRSRASDGLTLIETLVALALGAFVLLGLNGVVSRSLQARDVVARSHRRTEQARFALEHMVRAVRGTQRLLIPRAEKLATAYSESVRDVLAVALDPTIDRNGDGIADADNDGDGKVDEDTGRDMGNDGAPGLPGIDDDGDGLVDEGSAYDDDEDGAIDEDPFDGIDNDGDEDAANVGDDDGDGRTDEDWIDACAWFVSGGQLVERWPTPGGADGRQYTETPIADGVTLFRVERVAGAENRATLVDITLELTDASGEKVSLNARARVGGGG
jgi:type II secretory pathway pseudopilin PulG